MLERDLEKKAQLVYTETIKGLKSFGFLEMKGAEGQYGYTRISKDGMFNIWETVSFSKKTLYLFKQLNPWSPILKEEVWVADEQLQDVDFIISKLEEMKSLVI